MKCVNMEGRREKWLRIFTLFQRKGILTDELLNAQQSGQSRHTHIQPDNNKMFS